MHENLKYSFVLDENIKKFETFHSGEMSKEDFRSQLDDWQPIYSGIKYGTQFLIYAKILGVKEDSNFLPKNIQLYIQNYSGSNTIGFNNISGFFEIPLTEDNPIKDPRLKAQKMFQLNIGLQGFSNNNVIKNIPLEKTSLKQGDIIFTSPFFVPFDPSLSKIFDPASINSSVFLDELFMERQGDEIYVTDDGKNKIYELQSSYGIFTEDQINSLEESQKKSFKRASGEKELSKSRAKLLGRIYPCIPAYSICMCP